jgi:high-affinity nickel-transport protein
MDFLVGLTLIFLGVCVLKAALEQLSRREQFHPQSRGQIIWAFLKKRNGQAGSGDVEGYPGVSLSAQSGLLGASLVGVIHAVSAETGTQSLLIASVGDADSHGLGIVMLLAFIVGLLISNSLIAIFSAAGFVSSSASKFVLLSLSVVTAIFSIAVGVLFIAGLADLLPDLTANCNRLLRQ